MRLKTDITAVHRATDAKEFGRVAVFVTDGNVAHLIVTE